MNKIVATVVLIACAASLPASGAELTCADGFPEVGEARTVTLAGVERPELLDLWVVYSPNSETEVITEVGRFSADGEIVWTPAKFGIATLSARDAAGATVAAANVAIVYARAPISGVLVMLFAGALLFGGALLSLALVLREGVPKQLPPIDT